MLIWRTYWRITALRRLRLRIAGRRLPPLILENTKRRPPRVRDHEGLYVHADKAELIAGMHQLEERCGKE